MYGSTLVPIMKVTLPHESKFILSRKFEKTSKVWEMNLLIYKLRIEIEEKEKIRKENPETTDIVII